MLITLIVQELLIATLSQRLNGLQLGGNFRIKKGGGSAFSIGEIDQIESCVIVFDDLISFSIFVLKPYLLTFARLYIGGHIECEGDWFAFANFANKLNDNKVGLLEKFFFRLTPTQNVENHYGWDADAFACFLDQPYMQYTCGRFLGSDQISLEEAQINKFEHIGEWLRVQSGQRHLDVGCGWGGLVQYFAEKHKTISHGITSSPGQAIFARQHAKSKLVKFFLKDFAEFNPFLQYDIATVVGMIEHVPIARQAKFFDWLSDQIKIGGRVYLQCITSQPTRLITDRTRFLNQYVFAHELNIVEDIMLLAQKAGFHVECAEEGNNDYVFTLKQWVRRLRENEWQAKHLLEDDEMYRILLAYLTMGSLSFAQGHCYLHRLLLIKK